MGEYIVPTYEVSKALEMLHNSPRVMGDNIVRLPTSGGLSDEETDYLIGVGAGPAVMWVMFFVWLIALCVAGCCRNKCCGNKMASILFLGFMGISCFGWFYSISGNVKATGGVDVLFDQAEALMKLADDTVTNAEKVVTFINSVESLSDSAQVSCGPILNISGTEFPTADFSSLSGEVNASLQEIRTELGSISDELDNVVETVNPYLTKYELAYVILVSCIIALTAIFTLSTLFRVLKNAPGKDSGPITCISKLSGTCFMSVGVILLLLIWILIGVLTAITTIGADLCVPSPSENILRLLEEATQSSRTPGVALCDEAPYSYLCYYQTCEGENPLGIELLNADEVTGNITGIVSDLIAQVNETIALLEQTNVTVPGSASQCMTSLYALDAEIQTADDIIKGVTNSVECPSINPIYVGVVDAGLCNGVFTGIAVMWITMALGSAALMAGMLVYRIFKFDQFENGEWVEHDAQVVAYGDSSYSQKTY